MPFETLEIGACNDVFARRFLSNVCVSDKNYDPSLDVQCDAHKLPFVDGCFGEVFSCNPYGYGLKKEKEAFPLLKDIARVLTNDGRFVIIGHKQNPYCRNRPHMRQWAQVAGFSVEVEDLNAESGYSNHRFHRADDGRPTVPNIRIIFTKL